MLEEEFEMQDSRNGREENRHSLCLLGQFKVTGARMCSSANPANPRVHGCSDRAGAAYAWSSGPLGGTVQLGSFMMILIH